MTVNNDKQYRPISILETGYQNSFSIRYIKDMALNANNFKSKVSCHKIIADNWPIDGEMNSFATGGVKYEGFPPTPVLILLPTEEMIRMVYAPRYIPDGYTRLLVQSMHVRTAGTSSVTWKLRAVNRLFESQEDWTVFRGPGGSLCDCGFASVGFPMVETIEWTTSSNSVALFSDYMDLSIRDRNQQVWFLLTSTNGASDCFARLYNLDVTPALGA